MPAEWQQHERTFMAWPSADYTRNEAQYRAWANVANAIVDFEPVTLLHNVEDLILAKSFLSEKVRLVEAKLDDSWMRDIGPTFVQDGGQLRAISWTFNGWGAQGNWASWDNDNLIAEKVAELANKPVIHSRLVNEGGGIHVNGAGKLLLTETVQLGKGRNPDWSREQVEEEFHKLLDATEVIWIKRGLTRDYEEFGTQGHIDIVACFSDESTVLYHDQQDPKHPDYKISREVEDTLAIHSDLKLIGVPAPEKLTDHEGWVDYSYINHYIVNNAVILCAFDDPNDQVALEVLKLAYPNREIVLVDARDIFAVGGGIHCITQQQPA